MLFPVKNLRSEDSLISQWLVFFKEKNGYEVSTIYGLRDRTIVNRIGKVKIFKEKIKQANRKKIWPMTKMITKNLKI